MTLQSTTLCFVRIEDKDKRKEICEKLKKIGYNDVSTTDDVWLMTQAIDNTSKYLVEYMKIAINCGTNTDLFLALAGIRSDTDLGQIFTDGKRFCKSHIEKFGNDRYHNKYRKATATEIIEHFKNLE